MLQLQTATLSDQSTVSEQKYFQIHLPQETASPSMLILGISMAQAISQHQMLLVHHLCPAIEVDC